MQKARLNFSLPVSILKEGNAYVAYSPAVDLSTVGDTFEEAQHRFEEASQLFFEELMAEGTLEEALLELGWQKADHQLVPPVVVSQQIQYLSLENPSQLYA